MALSGSGEPSSTVQRYSRTAIALHWALAALLLAQMLLGWWMTELPKSPPGLRAGWFNVHKSVGVTIAFVVCVRMLWRATHPVPEPVLARWQRVASQAVHGMLYACMLLMPLSGFLGSSFTRYPIRLFGFVLPTPHVDWPAAKQLMSDLHQASAWAFVVLVALHVAAAAWHWLQRDGVAARMGLPSAS